MMDVSMERRSLMTTGNIIPIIPEAMSPDITFQEFFSIYFQDVKVRLKPSTIASKKRIFHQKILPFFGTLSMNEITPWHVRKWQSVILKQNYSLSYQMLIDLQLSAMMRYAQHYYDFPNPCIKAGHIGKSHAKSFGIWTPDDYELFISHFSSDPEAFTAFELLYWTGMRQGELLALTPNDIDAARRQIFVSKTYARIEGEDIISIPKTRKSIRTIGIPRFLSDEVTIYIRSNHILPDQRLFERAHHYLYYKMKKGCEASGVRKIRVHDLRHSHVSLLINAGFSALDISERVGHESVSTTLDIYSHLFPAQQKMLSDRLDELHAQLEM